jgi:hypothetical protein
MATKQPLHHDHDHSQKSRSHWTTTNNQTRTSHPFRVYLFPFSAPRHDPENFGHAGLLWFFMHFLTPLKSHGTPTRAFTSHQFTGYHGNQFTLPENSQLKTFSQPSPLYILPESREHLPFFLYGYHSQLTTDTSFPPPVQICSPITVIKKGGIIGSITPLFKIF